MRTYLAVALALSIAQIAPAVAASSEADFQFALAAAEAANKEAKALKNQWTTTAQEINAAKKAAAANDFDKAIGFAKEAEALARASIAQAHEQATAWKDADIH
jgi:hypothetical protein